MPPSGAELRIHPTLTQSTQQMVAELRGKRPPSFSEHFLVAAKTRLSVRGTAFL